MELQDRPWESKVLSALETCLATPFYYGKGRISRDVTYGSRRQKGRRRRWNRNWDSR